jgi:hypothetical protein
MKFRLQHKITIELPSQIKLHLKVETTDDNSNVSEDVRRLGESCKGETAGYGSPWGVVDEGEWPSGSWSSSRLMV